MAKLRKNSAYQSLKRPFTRVSKYKTKHFVNGGFPHLKLTRFNMGDVQKEYDSTLQLTVTRDMNLRHNSLEAARMTGNRLLEKTLGSNYHLRVKVYPFQVLREHTLAAGAGADRMSQGMSHSYGKPIGAAARVFTGQTVFELRLNKDNLSVGREALHRAAKKLPCSCKIVTL